MGYGTEDERLNVIPKGELSGKKVEASESSGCKKKGPLPGARAAAGGVEY